MAEKSVPSATGNLLKLTLETWASNSKSYKDLFKTLSKEALTVTTAAFNEMGRIAPGTYDFWWAREHVRFISVVKQRELLLLHEIMYNFLTAFARGELNESQGKRAKTKPAAAPDTKAGTVEFFI